jgi:hypothetical protein
MKKRVYIGAVAFAAAVICAVLGVGAILSGFTARSGLDHDTEYLRIHIRANGNSAEDQSVKYRVRDKIVEYLTHILADVKNAADAA